MRSKEKKKLTKSASDKMIAGVMGGFGEYFGINANYIRVAFVIFSVLSSAFPGILIYILLVVIMPADPNKPSFQDSLNNMMGNSRSQTEEPEGRKVIHDVDEEDENTDKGIK